MRTFHSIRLALSVSLLACALSSFAQAPRAAGPRPAMPGAAAGVQPGDILISKLTPVKSPRDYSMHAASVRGGTTQKSPEWGCFDVEFATKPLWIDELKITYTLMFDNAVNVQKGLTDKPFVCLQQTVSYRDVQQNRDHKAGVVVLPAALLRFGRPIGFAVQIFANGAEIIAKGESEGLLKGRDGWWANQNIIKSEKTDRRDDYMLDRMKSPFQLVEIDSYELSR